MSDARPCTGPLRLGVTPQVLFAHGADPRVRWCRTAASAVPVLVPLELLPWWSAPFFAERIGGVDAVRYVDWDSLRRVPEAAVADLGRHQPKVDPGCLWVSEVPEESVTDADAAVGHLAASLGATVGPVSLLAGEDAVEEHYVVHTELASPNRRAFDLHGAWSALVRSGKATPHDPDGPSLFLDPCAADLDVAWGIYGYSMAELSRSHPIRAELDRGAFESLILSTSGGALVARAGGVPVSLALLGTDLAHFEWLDPRWIEAVRGERTLFVFPGIVTRPELRHQGSISGLLDLVAQLFVAGGAPVTVLFSCDNVSRTYTPAIVQATADRGKPFVSGTVELAARYRFRAWAVAPSPRQA